MRLGSLPLMAMALVLAGLVAGCGSAPPRPTYADIRFNDEPPIRLAVGGVDIQSTWQPSIQPPHVEHLFPVEPVRVLENWARDRIAPAGGSARAVFVIEDASVIEVDLKKKESGVAAVFTNQPSQRYDATVQATLRIVDDRGTPVRYVTVKATRSETVLEDISPNDRDKTWYEMTKKLMADFDRQMSAEISANFGGYFN
ncbi:MAG TPA: hypothetical protein VLX85_00140 [Stellaceae bacterium]|nr:hypothetical protein [Stellaceae bacterium]